jgi:hypothetical protein
LVIPPEKLLYKTLPPFMIHFCSAPHFIFSSLLLSVCIKFLQEFLLFLLVVFNILKGMYSSFFIFVFFYFFFILIMFICVVFFVLCIVCG